MGPILAFVADVAAVIQSIGTVGLILASVVLPARVHYLRTVAGGGVR